MEEVVAHLSGHTNEDIAGSLKKLSYHGIDSSYLSPPTLDGEPTYIAIPLNVKKLVKIKERSWKWKQEHKGQPYGSVTFSPSINDSKIKIVPLDGILFGDEAHDAPRFDALLERIKSEKNTFCFLNGDAVAEVRGGNKDSRDVAFLERSSTFVQKMQSIAHKVLWAQRGCLEKRAHQNQGFDPLAYFCGLFDIPYFTEPVYIDIYWKKNLFTLWAMHGHSTAHQKGAKMNMLRSIAFVQDWTHFMVAGHVGDTLWNRAIKICRDPLSGRLVPREEFHVILGNFKRYLGTNAAQRGHQPPSTETLALYLYSDGAHHVKTDHWKGTTYV